MPLSSQMSRTGLSRRYRSNESRGGGSRRWPLVLVAVVAGGAGIYWWGGSAGDVVAPEAAVASETPVAPAAKPQPTRMADLAPVGATPTEAVPSFVLGGPAAPAPQPATATPAVGTPASAVPAAVPGVQPLTGAAYDASLTSSADVASAIERGMDLITDGRKVEGRRVLSDLLFGRTGEVAPADAQAIRERLHETNKELIFSPKIIPGDTVTEAYKVQPGDMLVKIGFRNKVPYQFYEIINNTEAKRLQAGRTLKIIKGPFHARVSKSEYRMDLFLRDAEGAEIYVTSFVVGLGESDSTPLGKWLIEPGRKVQNPNWSNPRTGEYYNADDPNNPIGEYWLALKGLDPSNETIKGYGIHGTNEPESIGRQMSMGCVRMRDADIELVYKMLQDGESTVEIVR